jgi:hypothetical protein
LINITAAGAGYPSQAAAIAAPASNIRTTIQVTDQTPYDMVSNGQYYLGVSNSELIIYDYAARTTDYTAFTITTDATSGIGLATPTITSTNTGFTLQTTSMALGASGITTKAIAIRWPVITANTTGTIIVKVGNLTKTVTITRKPTLSAGGAQELDGSNYVSGTMINAGTGSWFSISNGAKSASSGTIYSTTGKMYVTPNHNIALINGGSAPANRTGGEFYLVRTNDTGGGRIKVVVAQTGGVTTVIPNFYVGAFWKNNQKGERLIKITGLTSGYNGGGRIKVIASQAAGAVTTIIPDFYIGAFWRNNQKGERLIKVTGLTTDYRGSWTARVVSGKEWIMLDKEDTQNDTYYPYAINATANMEDMLDPAIDNKHSLPGGKLVVSDATNATQIYFRIGLRERLAAGAEPRYGLIIVSYNNNTKFHPIFIRQGEQPDFLFRNNNAEDAYSGTNRTLSVKFSAFNLTDPLGFVGSTTVADHTVLPVIGQPVEKHFTDYPSQGGYYFQWVSERRAFHPANQDGGYTTQPVATDGYWNALLSPEVCPTGYRRPIDGVTNGSTTVQNSTSEQLQSLWLKPNNSTSELSNTIFGFYADGFFDRRTRTTPLTEAPMANSSVSYHASTPELNKNIAHRGAIIFNPNTLHSLFFPFAGSRYPYTGGLLHLREVGKMTMNFSRSRGATPFWWLLYDGASMLYMDLDLNRHRTATVVRCVKI